MTPVELVDVARAYYARRNDHEKAEWRRMAFLAAWIINTAGKTYRSDVSADELVKFKDEAEKEGIKPLSLEERKRQADESFMQHKQKAWMLLRLDEEGKVKIFDETKLIELKERFRKPN